MLIILVRMENNQLILPMHLCTELSKTSIIILAGDKSHIGLARLHLLYSREVRFQAFLMHAMASLPEIMINTLDCGMSLIPQRYVLMQKVMKTFC